MGKSEAQVNGTKVGGLLQAGVSAAYLEHLTCAHHHSGGLLRFPSSASINVLFPLYPHCHISNTVASFCSSVTHFLSLIKAFVSTIYSSCHALLISQIQSKYYLLKLLFPLDYLLKVDYLPITHSHNKIILEYISEAVVIYSSICLVCLLLWTLSP